MVPAEIDAAAVIARAYKRYNLSLGAGLSKVAGKLFRIGHLGDLNELMLLGAIAGSEMAMLDLGMRIEPGSGVAATQSLLAEGLGDAGDVFLDRASLKAKLKKFAFPRRLCRAPENR